MCHSAVADLEWVQTSRFFPLPFLYRSVVGSYSSPIFTALQRSGEGNVSIRVCVCHSVNRVTWGSLYMADPLDMFKLVQLGPYCTGPQPTPGYL